MPLAQKIVEVVRSFDLAGRSCKPKGAVAVPTDLFIRLLQGQINKYCAAFEHVLAVSGTEFVSFEWTKIMLMLLRTLRWCYSAQDIAREGGLSWDCKSITRSDGRPAYRQGMSLMQTMESHGFGWLLPKFDVQDWMFRDDVTSEMLFANPAIEQAYGRRWQEIQRGTDSHRQIARIDGWLRRFRHQDDLTDDLVLYLSWLCLQEYRRYVFGQLQKDLVESYKAGALAGRIPICLAALGRVTNRPIHLITGNKTRWKHVGSLVDFLWEVDDEVQRKHWDQASYRQLHRAIQRMLRMHDQLIAREAPLESRFGATLSVIFIQHNWILLYPDGWVFFQRTKPSLGSQRMWYGLRSARLSELPQHVPTRLVPSHFFAGLTVDDFEWTQVPDEVSMLEPVGDPRFARYGTAPWIEELERIGQEMDAAERTRRQRPELLG